MTAKFILPAMLLAAGVAVGGAAPAATDPEFDYQGVRYACTGVGESKFDPRWSYYPVKLVFAAANGDYLADAETRIVDQSGVVVFEARCTSPWVLVDLPPGVYHVEAVAQQTYRRSFDLAVAAGGQTERILLFSEITE